MKGAVIAFLFLFSITSAAAVPTLNLQNENLQPGETLLATISVLANEQFAGQLNLDNIEFLEGRKQVFVEHDIVSYNDKYYFYAYLNREGNFTLKISNILYKDTQTSKLKEATLEKTIIVKENPIIIQEEKTNQTTNETYYENQTITKILSIKPGFFFGTQQPEFTLENKGSSELNLTYNENQILLISGAKQKIPINQDSLNQTLSFLEIKTYKTFSVPIIYLSSEVILGQTTILKASPQYLHVNLIAGKEKQETIEIFNFINAQITGILITSNISIMEITNKEELETFEPKANKNLSLNFESEKTGFTQGEILMVYTADNKKYNLTIPVFAYILPENSSEEDLQSIKDYDLLKNECETSGGKVCAVGETCSENETYNGIFCCIANCESTSSGDDNGGSGWSWLIGIIIILVLAAAGFFAYKKFKKVKPISPEQTIQKSSEDYESRISGGLSRT